MELGLILFIAVILISLTVFIVFLVKTARQWGVVHLLLLCTLFIESWVFLYFAAGVQYERVRATRDAFRYRQEAEAAVERGRQLRYGSVDAPFDSLEAVIPVQGQLERLTVDRGRVWRQLAFVSSNQDRVELVFRPQLTEVDSLGTETAPASPLPAAGASLPQELVVYAFQEDVNSDGFPLPVFYLGEYRVTKSDAATGEIGLESTLPMHPMHRARIEQGTASWTLYEMLPIDSHVAFSAPGSEPNEETIFGRPDEAEIRRLMANVPESTINSYLRDGQRASDDDRPETVWEQVNLLSELQVDVDSDQSADATVSGYFDQVGRSIDIRLKRNEPVILLPGELRDNRIVVMDSVARDLINRGVAERVQRVFVRPLNDYLGLFNRAHSLGFELAERIKYYQYQNGLIEQINQAGQNMVAFRQKENQLLSSDLMNFQKEIQFLNNATVAADTELESLKQKLSSLYRAIQDQHSEIFAGS